LQKEQAEKKIVEKALSDCEGEKKQCFELKTVHNFLGLSTLEWSLLAGAAGLTTGFYFARSLR
jgi:hypothetical protein